MDNLLTLILVYIAGGLTFIPFIASITLLYLYRTSRPARDAASSEQIDTDTQRTYHDEKEKDYIARLPDNLRRGTQESDVASDYFAVCRDYVPGGVNGRPPERTTPTGEVVTTESPSVYQSMYRSIFDRKSGTQQDTSHPNGRPFQGVRNVFWVVLRHGHLMLYEDNKELEVKHVIPLEHHHVTIYGDEGEDIPEGELWIKRNAIKLWWNGATDQHLSSSQPYFLFCEDCSKKEDFYFAILQNKRAKSASKLDGPVPERFDMRHIVGLVKKLHSTEDQLQTRWINALIGRVFLAVYKTQDAERYIRSKITRKLSRVKKPAFLSRIVVGKIDMGEGGPYITNPKLRDLTVDGECCAEADVEYSGKFRLEVSTRARIDLGARFKVREVDLVLAVVVKKVQGHVLIKAKPPPSNRLWTTFEKPPTVELSIEPIVSSRQITYSVILRAIEHRIKEIVAETCVLPNWDDIPFTDTIGQQHRGGIWENERQPATVPIPLNTTTTEDYLEAAKDQSLPKESALPLHGNGLQSSTALPETVERDLRPRKVSTTLAPSGIGVDGAGSTGIDSRPPKVIRSRSFASAADPLLNTDSASIANSPQQVGVKSLQDAASTMKAISTKSLSASPVAPPPVTPTSPTLWQNSQRRKNDSISSISSSKSTDADDYLQNHRPLQSPLLQAPPSGTSSLGSRSMKAAANNEVLGSKSSQASHSAHAIDEKRYSAASFTAATAAAKKWGWDVVAKASERKSKAGATPDPKRLGTPNNPIGASHPLPEQDERPPLPSRQGPKTRTSVNVPKRKPIPASFIDKTTHDREEVDSSIAVGNGRAGGEDESEGDVQVVEAPSDSGPNAPDDKAKPSVPSTARGDGEMRDQPEP